MDNKYELNVTHPIDAVYSDNQQVLADKAIKFIDALPQKMTDQEITQFYYEKFPIRPTTQDNPFVQEEEVYLLDQLRMPLKPIYNLEKKFLSILKISYRARFSSMITANEEVVVNDEAQIQSECVDMMTKGDGHTGASFLGVGGCGKTCAINRLLSRYPQTLIHHLNSDKTIQIVWLYVQPSSNSDLSTLMDSIGDAIDRALCNKKSVYGKYIRNLKKLGQKGDMVANLLRIFNVGVLVIDEIQRFNTFINKDESFEILLTITNKSKVGLLVCGTEDAYEKFLRKYYILRRMGEPLRASLYCNDYEYFKQLAGMVMSIQWFKDPQQITEDLVQTMYFESAGIIERIIGIWENVQLEYINLPSREKANFKLTPEFIQKCSNQENPLLGIYARQTLQSDFLSYKETVGEKVENEALDSTKKSIEDLKHSSNPLMHQTIYSRVKSNLLEAKEIYPDDLILNTVNKVANLKQNKNKSEDELVAITIQKVRKNKKSMINPSAIENNNKLRTERITQIDFNNL